MADYFKPPRGTLSAALQQNIKLKNGEIFFEVPDTGPGSGPGKIKMGDGETEYADLPYFISVPEDVSDLYIDFVNSTEATGIENNPTYLNNISPGSLLKNIFTNLKQLLVNYNSEITENRINIDNLTVRVSTAEDNIEQLSSNLSYSPESRNSIYRGKHLGNIHSLETVRELLIDENHNFRDVFLGDTVTMDFDIEGKTGTEWSIVGFNIFIGMLNYRTAAYDGTLRNNHIVLMPSRNNNFLWQTKWDSDNSHYNGTYYYSNAQNKVEAIGISINNKLNCLEHIYCPVSSQIDLNKESKIEYLDATYYGVTINSVATQYINPDDTSLGYYQNYAMLPSEGEIIGKRLFSSSSHDNRSCWVGKFPIFNFINPKKFNGNMSRSYTRSYSFYRSSSTSPDHHIATIAQVLDYSEAVHYNSAANTLQVKPFIVIS